MSALVTVAAVTAVILLAALLGYLISQTRRDHEDERVAGYDHGFRNGRNSVERKQSSPS